MPSQQSSYPHYVQTPNGGGVCIGRTFGGMLVRHGKGKDINLELTVDVISQTNQSGWLVVYREEDLSAITART
jgi:hypothetical protein